MSKKIKKYKGDVPTDEIKMDVKVFLFLRGSCLKTNLQKSPIKLSSVNDAEFILTNLERDGLVKRIQYADKKTHLHAKTGKPVRGKTDIFSMIRVDGQLLEFVQGIFRYWNMNIRGKKRIQHKLHPNEKALFERYNWAWGEESTKRWAKYVEKLSGEILTNKPKVESDNVYDETTIQKTLKMAGLTESDFNN